jgi:hypothetical protein
VATVKRSKRLPMAPAFYDPERDGVTQSLLSKFKQCRELTRNALEGWTGKFPAAPLVYGSLAHYVLEQAYKRIEQQRATVPSQEDVLWWLGNARDIWKEENPAASDISINIFEDSFMKNAAILPQYFKYWKTDFTTREWVALEREFKVPMSVTLPDGRLVSTFLRGKMDGVFRTPKAKSRPKALRLFETKNQASVNEEQLIDTLSFNLQTSVYLLALQKLHNEVPAEVEMNIIRKTALRQGKKEAARAFEARIVADVRERPDHYFVRMGMSVDPGDVVTMEKEVTALVVDFLFWWYGGGSHYRNDKACYFYNRPCDMIKKCATDDTTQLFKRDRVFSELEEL